MTLSLQEKCSIYSQVPGGGRGFGRNRDDEAARYGAHAAYASATAAAAAVPASGVRPDGKALWEAHKSPEGAFAT